MPQVIVEHQVLILSALLLVSEALSLIPAVKANGIFQFVYGLLKKKKAEEAV